jgi:hypothetical protein
MLSFVLYAIDPLCIDSKRAESLSQSTENGIGVFLTNAIATKQRSLRAWSARGGRAQVILNLCERDHHHHRIDRTLVESGTHIETLRLV